MSNPKNIETINKILFFRDDPSERRTFAYIADWLTRHGYTHPRYGTMSVKNVAKIYHREKALIASKLRNKKIKKLK